MRIRLLGETSPAGIATTATRGSAGFNQATASSRLSPSVGGPATSASAR